jgi:hypothetical protein
VKEGNMKGQTQIGLLPDEHTGVLKKDVSSRIIGKVEGYESQRRVPVSELGLSHNGPALRL